MWKILLVSTLFCAYLTLTSSVKVSVYYEALCPDSIRFITTQFTKGYEVYEDKMVVDFIPFGFATAVNVSGSWEFTCQHGDGECYGNKVQACVIASYSSEASTNFVICAMSSGNASLDANLQDCATQYDILWSEIDDCLTSGDADSLLVANGIRTNGVTPSISFIPTIVYNDVYNDTLQDLSISDFQEAVEILIEEEEEGGNGE